MSDEKCVMKNHHGTASPPTFEWGGLLSWGGTDSVLGPQNYVPPKFYFSSDIDHFILKILGKLFFL